MKKNNRLKLVKLTSKTPRYIICSCCDETTFNESTSWYQSIEKNSKYLSWNTYLDCCSHKIGDIVDSITYEEYMSPLDCKGEEVVPGILKKDIKGYIKQSS